MPLTGLHLLLTYQCTLECDHCFVWGSPVARGTMTLRGLRTILRQARAFGGIEWIYFEGGEPFLMYPLLLHGVRLAARAGFHVGIVSNAYWATGAQEAREWLRPLRGLAQDLSISSDLYHRTDDQDRAAEEARTAAEALGIPCSILRVAPPEAGAAAKRVGQLPPGESAVMFRGRAAVRLSPRASPRPWHSLHTCPYETLRAPGRVHIDPYGYVHLCQGIALGNVFESSLREIFDAYVPERHPITAPLLEGGPTALVETYRLPHRDAYADACHLCYESRKRLRRRFPAILGPDQMYGVL